MWTIFRDKKDEDINEVKGWSGGMEEDRMKENPQLPALSSHWKQKWGGRSIQGELQAVRVTSSSVRWLHLACLPSTTKLLWLIKIYVTHQSCLCLCPWDSHVLRWNSWKSRPGLSESIWPSRADPVAGVRFQAGTKTSFLSSVSRPAVGCIRLAKGCIWRLLAQG